MKFIVEWRGRRPPRRRPLLKPTRSYWARKAASRETDSPSGLVRTSCCGPAAMVGVVSESVLMSLNVTVAGFPPRLAVVEDWTCGHRAQQCCAPTRKAAYLWCTARKNGVPVVPGRRTWDGGTTLKKVRWSWDPHRRWQVRRTLRKRSLRNPSLRTCRFRWNP